MKMLDGTWLAYLEEIEVTAKEMVGKTVSYAIIDDILFIYEIKENKEN